MSKITPEQRSALQSARAKNRKAGLALVNGDISVPKHIVTKMKALDEWFTAQITPAKKDAGEDDSNATEETGPAGGFSEADEAQATG